MSRNRNRTPPFPGFSRGLPIVGQGEPRPAAGAYFYQVPVLVNREGRALAADSYEIRLPMPLEGVRFKSLAAQITEEVRKKEPDAPAPTVVLLQPIFLGFIPEDRLPVDEGGNGATTAGGES